MARSVGPPEYFQNIIADMLLSDIVAVGYLKSLTNKAVYAEMTSSLPPPKLVMESDCDYSVVLGRVICKKSIIILNTS